MLAIHLPQVLGATEKMVAALAMGQENRSVSVRDLEPLSLESEGWKH